MANYQILDHKADLKIKFLGKNKKELFQNAAEGMQSALRPKIKIGGKRVKRKIAVNSLDLESLLVDFLSELNYLNETKGEIYDHIKFIKFSDNKIGAEISGRKVKGFGVVIKGVTYYGLEIRQRKDGICEATMVFDV